MNCLVTGATGFLGTNLVHLLVQAGWSVRASGYPGSETKYIAGLPIEYVSADITEPEQVREIVRGCDVVFHVAGDTSFWKKRFALQRRINVEGTANIARACMEYDVKRLVHTSTIDVLGYNPDGESFNEDGGRLDFLGMGYNYAETKLEAEQHLRAIPETQLEIVYIYPGFMLGPFDHGLQLGRVFFDLKAGRVPGSPPGGGSFCHVSDVARAHIAAAERGRPGRGYICAGDERTNLSYTEAFARMARAVGASPPRLGTLPASLFTAYGYLLEFAAGFSGQAPDMNPGQARYLSKRVYASSERAIAELDYRVQDLEACIADALSWYRENGFKI